MKKIYTAILVFLICSISGAQSFRTGYFLDNYTYGYRINPAAGSTESFFGIALGNIDLQNRSSIGLSSFLFPSGNSLVTGLNSSVDADTFLSRLSETNGLNLDESINILSMGFAKEKHTSTIELNIRATAGVSLPYDLFAFLKKGGSGNTYNIGGIFANVSAIADLNYGYSRKINDRLSVGARIHALAGLTNANIMGNGSSLSLSESQVSLNADIDITTSGLIGVEFEGGEVNPDNISVGMNSSPGGYGASLDFGAIYEPVDNLEISFAVNDLGGISWKNNATVKLSGESSFKGGSITFDDGNLTTDFEDIADEVLDAFDFEELGQSGRFVFLPMTIIAGARYRMPFYKGLSAGLLATYHTGKFTSWYDLRVGATITPARIISATANVGTSTFGPTFGAALNTHLGPINLILGIDSYMGKMARVESFSVPANKFQENIHLGLAVSF